MKVLLGISGGIAAYKIPELVRLLVTEHHEVRTILTESAHRFVTEHTLSVLTSHRVRSDLWDLDAEQAMGHIEFAKWPDNLVIAPATANTISKLARGICDDLLSTTYLATTSSVIVVPSMNKVMWEHPANLRNVEQLRRDGATILPPAHGEQACGDVGLGRMPEPVEILTRLKELWRQPAATSALAGVKVLVSAGPTQESIDPVRYLSNRSSGKQGFEIAQAAREAGATVILVSGPVNLMTPVGVERIDVQTAAEMKSAILNQSKHCDIFFSVAAVCDFQPQTVYKQKLKRPTNPADSHLTLDVLATEDILRSVTKQQTRPFVVGFAAETDDVIQNARKKLVHKKLDMIVVNDVSDTTIGFDSDDNQVTIICPEAEQQIKKQSKHLIAKQIIEIVASKFSRNS